ncbi:MAG TPA: tetratricopeptide repeat protein [Steroidobacteraceae bacterium]|nr:tetratricopeptide repeat protein [Steroidobacteraceae bacterium]
MSEHSKVQAALRAAHQAQRAGRLDEARALCGKILQLEPRQLEAVNLLGIIAAQTGDAQRAAALFGEALRLDPRSIAALINRGNALRALKEPAAALASFEHAIEIKPDHAPGHHHRGNALFELRRYEAAIASHEAAIALEHDYGAAYFERARALMELMRYEAALESLERAIALAPKQPGAWYLRGNALYALQRYGAALESYDRSLALKPDANTYHNRGNALAMLERPESAIASYTQAIALNPKRHSSYGARLHARMQIADWREFPSELARLVALIERDEAASNPFTLLALCDSAPLQLRAARSWVREKCPPNAALGPLPARSRRERIRVGYFSADFRNHATSYLTAQLFEIHDRSKLELTAFSLGADTKDEMRKRTAAAFERFLDVRGKSDTDIAQLARSLEIDIAVDLGGFTRGARPGIFALRAAPIQVSYLGFLGTLAAEYMDYLIADETIVPQADQKHYCEKIVWLPSYQVNDSKRPIAEKRFSRQELGLPPTGFVFCCFNASYKITPATFDGWMRILRRVPGSSLLLLGGHESLERNLRREAQARGVAAERLVFGARLSMPEYLARYRAADLFLDTLPYNAGTTASDALWAGLPVLTVKGETFASRIGASLLAAVGLPELIASSQEHYERLAVELASDPTLLTRIRAKLTGELPRSRLFDTEASARHLEAAFTRMYERYHAGLPPAPIRIDG